MTPSPPSTTTTINRTTSDDGGTIILNKYHLTHLLGRGNFAKVYHARSLSDNSSVAVKVIHKPSVSPAMEPRLLREVAAMRRLNHPNIIKLHEVMATKTKIFLVMELAAGGELFTKLIRQRHMKEPTARFFFQQLVSALYFCHQHGVAHRDLKPQNLLLDKQGNLKISDFGLSALPESRKDGLLHTACGTPAFTAPEIVRGKGYDGAKADAWSCGVILFNLLAGFLPFDDANLPVMYRKIYSREIGFSDWIRKQARVVIRKLLDPNPETRMSIEDLMGCTWFKKSLKPDPTRHIISGLDPIKSLKPEPTRHIISGLDPTKSLKPDPTRENGSELDLAESFESDQARDDGSELDRAGFLKPDPTRYEGSEMDPGKCKRVMNAFDIISMSSGLDLSGMFEEKVVRRPAWRFTMAVTAEEVKRRVIESGGRLGYVVKRMGEDGVIGLVKGRVVVMVRVAVVVPEVVMVEVKVVDGGEGVSEGEWEELKVGFEGLRC